MPFPSLHLAPQPLPPSDRCRSGSSGSSSSTLLCVVCMMQHLGLSMASTSDTPLVVLPQAEAVVAGDAPPNTQNARRAPHAATCRPATRHFGAPPLVPYRSNTHCIIRGPCARGRFVICRQTKSAMALVAGVRRAGTVWGLIPLPAGAKPRVDPASDGWPAMTRLKSNRTRVPRPLRKPRLLPCTHLCSGPSALAPLL